MDTTTTCKYYVTKLLGISPQKPNCVYDVRSGNVHDRKQKSSLFRVFYRSNGRCRKNRYKANSQESYQISIHEDEVGVKTSDGYVLEEDTVEDIEKKFQGFRNVFEKCKVKKKKPRLYNVSSGLRFTIAANTMLIDGKKKANKVATKINAEGDAIEENKGCDSDNNDEDVADESTVDIRVVEVGNDLDIGTVSQLKCPKDVTDKVNSWIDSSAKQTGQYSQEENVFVDEKIKDMQ